MANDNEELISSLFDTGSIQKEVDFVGNELKGILDYVKQINGYKISLNKSGLSDTVDISKDLKTTLDALTRTSAGFTSVLSQMSNQFVSTAKSIKETTDSVKKVDESIGSTSSADKRISSLKQLVQQYKQAQQATKDAVAQYSAESQAAQVAADKENALKQKIDSIIASYKDLIQTKKEEAEIPFTSNTDQLNSEQIKTSNATGSTVNTEEIAATQQQLTVQSELNGAKQEEIDLNAQETSAAAEDASITKLLAEAKDKLAFSLSEANVQLQGYALQTAEANAAAKLEAEQALGLSGAYKKLTIDLATAKIEAKNLAAEFGVDSVEAKQAAATVTALDQQVKLIDKTVGESQRNVGNYGSAFTSAFGNAFSYVRQLAYILPGIGIAGIFNVAFTAISDLVSNLKIFAAADDEAKRSQDELDESVKGAESSYVNASNSVLKLQADVKLAKDGFVDKSVVVKEYNDTLGAAIGKVSSLDEVEKSLTDNAQNYIHAMFLKAVANQALEESSKKAYEAEQKRSQSPTDFLTGYEKTVNAIINVTNEGNAAVKDFFGGNSDVGKLFEQTQLPFSGVVEQVKGVNDSLKNSKSAFNIFESYLQQAEDFANAHNINLDPFGDDKTKAKRDDSAKKFQEYVKDQFTALAKYSDEYQQNQLDKFQTIATDENATAGLRILALKKYEELKSQQIQQDADNEIAINHSTAAQALAIRQQAANDIIKLEGDTGNKIATIQNKVIADANKQKLDNEEKTENAIDQIGDEATAHLKANRQKDVDDAKKAAETKKEIDKTFYDLEKELADETIGFIQSLVDGSIDRQKNQLQELANQQDENYQREVDNTNNSVLNTDEKYKQLQILSVQHQAQQDAIAAQQKKLDIKKAEFDKAAAIAKIVVDTAKAEVDALSYLSNPLTAAFYPEIAALIGAIGALQLATAIATPIPKYRRGTKDHPGGFAVLGDGGKKEIAFTPAGDAYITPDKSTLVDLPKHTIVHPDADKFLKTAISISHPKIPALDRTSSEKVHFEDMTKRLEKKFNSLQKTIANKKEFHYTVDALGVQLKVKEAMNQIIYMNENMQF